MGIVTRNRPDSLRRTLTSLRSQSLQPYEVIISDDSDSEFIDTVRTLAVDFGCHYKKGPKRGLYANRNAVAASCRGTHIRTMDDDHEFPENHIKKCLEAIDTDPDSVWIIGEFHANKDYDRHSTPPCPGELHPRGFSVTPTDPHECRAISCGATIYPRSIIDRNIKNCEKFKFGASYLEYGCRLASHGYRIRQLMDTFVIHHVDEAGRSFPYNLEYESAQVYAMLSMSWRWQPTWKNKFLTSLELLRRITKRPSFELHAIYAARRVLQIKNQDAPR